MPRAWRSPELLRFALEWTGDPGPVVPGDDLWALGVTAYILLTREVPFGDRNTKGMTRAILHETPVPPHERNPRVPRALLPQTVKPGSGWEQAFPSETVREATVHRLGNLVLLTHRKNSQASNYEFGDKVQKYFSMKAGVTNFALTNTVLKLGAWTQETFDERQADLVEKLKLLWNL
jgi:hypothetical protein